MSKAKDPSLFPETNEIITVLSREADQDIVIVMVPSHDRKNKELSTTETAEWASNAMRLLADLYGGATAFETYKGIFKTDEGHYLLDKPRSIESLARVDDIHDPVRLNQLVGFAKRMGKALDQDTIMLIFGNVAYYIQDYSGV